MPDERREVDRTELLGELPAAVSVIRPVAIRELSPHGAQVEIGCALQLNSLHEFRLHVGDRSLVVKGRIVHCAVSHVDQEQIIYRTGIEFVEPSPQTSRAIAEFLHQIKMERAQLR